MRLFHGFLDFARNLATTWRNFFLPAILHTSHTPKQSMVLLFCTTVCHVEIRFDHEQKLHRFNGCAILLCPHHSVAWYGSASQSVPKYGSEPFFSMREFRSEPHFSKKWVAHLQCALISIRHAQWCPFHGMRLLTPLAEKAIMARCFTHQQLASTIGVEDTSVNHSTSMRVLFNSRGKFHQNCFAFLLPVMYTRVTPYSTDAFRFFPFPKSCRFFAG